MLTPEIEQLIGYALADGTLSEKERSVLMRKAQEAGVDMDEFEMILDARLYERKKELQKEQAPAQPAAQPVAQPAARPAAPPAPKSNKLGELRKCPACGNPIQAMQATCPECGHNFSGVEANASFTNLIKMLDKIESQRKEDVLGIFSYITGIGAGNNEEIDNRKKELIKNYPVPTTKEDLMEFLSMAIPNAKTIGNFFTRSNEENKPHNDFVPVWKAKCEQVMIKARMVLKDDKDVMAIVSKYAAELGISL